MPEVAVAQQPRILQSYAVDRWIAPKTGHVAIPSAIDGRAVAQASSAGLDFAAMVRHAREVGGPALRAMTFHQRADLLKALATYLNERKEALYELAFDTGATRRDSAIDIEGGIGVLFAYTSRGRRELPSERFVIDGGAEALSKGGSFIGLHVLTPLHGVAVHINAFNFPVWGLVEKLGPALLAGVPVITKPATATAYVAEALVRLIVESGVLPKGALQFVSGGLGDLLDHLTGQDVLSFTGSLETSEKLRNHPAVSRNAVRFIAERDSLNAAVLGPDAAPGTPEFDLFVKEVVREMTAKAGQKCTAIRRIFISRTYEAALIAALSAKLAEFVPGDPRLADTRMGALVSTAQRTAVEAAIAEIGDEVEIVHDANDQTTGAFMAPVLLRAKNPATARRIHAVEPFGPVATVLAYDTLDEAIELVAKGEGSLVATLATYDPDVAEAFVFGVAHYHGRLLILDRDCAKESTGHGSPMPGLIHGGPGRAGGGEEMGGLRGVYHYLQRTALQGSPARLSALTRRWIKGAPATVAAEHPFRRNFDALAIGDTVETASRVVTLGDIEHFAAFTGDNFYAHMDEEAAAKPPIRSSAARVAHGYLLLSFAAGLFVDPAAGTGSGQLRPSTICASSSRFRRETRCACGWRSRRSRRRANPNTAKCGGCGAVQPER